MNEVNSKQDDEIDLIELFMTLWRGKWIIVCCTASALIIAGSYLFLKEPDYESRISIEEASRPPFLREGHIIERFRKFFYLDETLLEWKAKHSNSNLDSLFNVETKNNALFSNPQPSKLISLNKYGARNVQIVIKSNDLDIIKNLYMYSVFIESKITSELRALTIDEIDFIKRQSKELNDTTDYFTKMLFEISRYVRLVNRGEAQTIQISKPSYPQKISPKSNLIVALSLVLGGFIGCGVVLLMSVLQKRKEIAVE